MTAEMVTITGPAAWASAIVNGDFSGLDPDESAACREWLEREQQDGWRIVDVARRASGEPEEAWFSWSYWIHGGTADGGDVCDYVARKVAP